jgi:hypothetical protein
VTPQLFLQQIAYARVPLTLADNVRHPEGGAFCRPKDLSSIFRAGLGEIADLSHQPLITTFCQPSAVGATQG